MHWVVACSTWRVQHDEPDGYSTRAAIDRCNVGRTEQEHSVRSTHTPPHHVALKTNEPSRHPCWHRHAPPSPSSTATPWPSLSSAGGGTRVTPNKLFDMRFAFFSQALSLEGGGSTPHKTLGERPAESTECCTARLKPSTHLALVFLNFVFHAKLHCSSFLRILPLLKQQTTQKSKDGHDHASVMGVALTPQQQRSTQPKLAAHLHQVLVVVGIEWVILILQVLIKRITAAL